MILPQGKVPRAQVRRAPRRSLPSLSTLHPDLKSVTFKAQYLLNPGHGIVEDGAMQSTTTPGLGLSSMQTTVDAYWHMPITATHRVSHDQ